MYSLINYGIDLKPIAVGSGLFSLEWSICLVLTAMAPLKLGWLIQERLCPMTFIGTDKRQTLLLIISKWPHVDNINYEISCWYLVIRNAQSLSPLFQISDAVKNLFTTSLHQNRPEKCVKILSSIHKFRTVFASRSSNLHELLCNSIFSWNSFFCNVVKNYGFSFYYSMVYQL